MMLLRALKDVMLNGKLIHLGEYISTDNPKLFLQHEYARSLTMDETQTILTERVKYAEKLFSEVPDRTETAQEVPKKTIDQGRLF